jgi:hypothetical protein
LHHHDTRPRNLFRPLISVGSVLLLSYNSSCEFFLFLRNGRQRRYATVSVLSLYILASLKAEAINKWRWIRKHPLQCTPTAARTAPSLDPRIAFQAQLKSISSSAITAAAIVDSKQTKIFILETSEMRSKSGSAVTLRIKQQM